MVIKAMEAAEQLAKEGVSARVINMHTIKPLDHELVIESAEKQGRLLLLKKPTYWADWALLYARL